MKLQARKSWESAGTGCLPGAPATGSRSSPRRLRLLVLTACLPDVFSATPVPRAPSPVPACPMLAPCGPGAAVPAPQRRAGPPGRVHMRGAAAWPRRSSRRPQPPPAPQTQRKANRDVLVSALLEAQEGGNQCLVNGKRENRSGKTVYFQAGEGLVNSTGHCGGSTAGHKTPPAEECSLSEP